MAQLPPNIVCVNHVNRFKNKPASLSLICLVIFSLLWSGCESPSDKYSKSNVSSNEVTVIEGTQWSAKESPDVPDVITEVSNLTAEVPPKKKTVNLSGYYLQIGAFLNANNAKRLKGKLEDRGFTPHLIIQNTKDKRWNLLRLGPYANKAEALDAGKKFTDSEKMDAIVLHNNLVIKNYSTKKETKRDPTPKLSQKRTASLPTKPDVNAKKPASGTKTDASKPAVSSVDKPFSFQIGGLYSTENAKKYLRKYQQKGYAPYLIEIKDKSSNDLWYSIRVGHYASAQEAIDAAQLFSSKEGLPAQIRPLQY